MRFSGTVQEKCLFASVSVIVVDTCGHPEYRTFLQPDRLKFRKRNDQFQSPTVVRPAESAFRRRDPPPCDESLLLIRRKIAEHLHTVIRAESDKKLTKFSVSF